MRHLTDQQILLTLDGETSPESREHFEACEQCRARRQELAGVFEEFVRVQPQLPDVKDAREKLKSRLRAEAEPRREKHAWIGAAAALAVLAFGVLASRSDRNPRNAGVVQAAILSLPDPRLTPGVALLVSRPALCAQPNSNNKAVPAALQRKVFAEYGIAGAPSRAYEVDYLVTPALGGADDIHNLWPHSYSATIWNAQVKDALEDRLHEMVCAGRLELRDAQQEIAADWIAAYRKYFHTDQPLAEHARRREP